MLVKDEFITINDGKYRVRHLFKAEKTASTPLVFLHDALGSIDQWKNFPEQLANSCELDALIIERQGHGQSSPFTQGRDKSYLHWEALVVLPQVLRALNVIEPILIGHSDGGTIALLYASEFQPRAVISIAAHILLEELTLQSIQKALQESSLIKDKLARYHGDKTDALFDAWWQTWLSEDFGDWNITKELQNIHAPVLVIQSKDDEYGSRRQVENIVSNVLSKNVTVYEPEEGGHAPHLKLPEDVILQASDFILKLF